MKRRLMFERLFDHNTQCNRQLLDLAEQLSDEQLQTSHVAGYHSLAETITHLLTVEWAWSSDMRTGSCPDPWPPFTEPPPIDVLRERNAQEDATFRAYLADLNEDAFDQRIEVADSPDDVEIFTLWEMLMHRLLHSAQHRSELAWMLTNFGHSPGDTDYLDYAQEQPLEG